MLISSVILVSHKLSVNNETFCLFKHLEKFSLNLGLH